MFAIQPVARILALGLAAFSFAAFAAENDSQAPSLQPSQQTWHVSRFSGDVWLVAPGVQQASLSEEAALNPGDTIRTGPNGRVLLTRGAESMIIAPNSVVGLPAEAKPGLSTTIVQRAGSVLLDVEKRNVQHFAVETPYLAAVVKGTQFRVTVTASGANVAVSRGQVEVADFKSGQIAQVLAGQAAKVSASGQTGLSLSGSGTFRPIEHGQPRAPSIEKIVVPRGGFTAPRTADGLQVRNLNAQGNTRGGGQAFAKRDGAHSAVRVSTALGDVKLNFSKVTHGMAHGVGASPGATHGHGNKDTVWNANGTGVNDPAAGSSANSSAVTAVTTVASAPAAASAASGNSGGTNAFNQTSASGNQGIGNGKSNANNGNGNSNGNGNGNSNQAGNNGIGNGNGNGRGHKL